MMQWQCIVGYILDTVRLGLDIVTAMKFFIEVYRMAIVSESQIIIYRQYHMNELEKKKKLKMMDPLWLAGIFVA